MIQNPAGLRNPRLVVRTLTVFLALGSVASAFSQTISGVSFRLPAIYGGGNVMGTVSLSSASTTPVTVSLSSSNPNLIVPETVTIPANSLSQSFTANSLTVGQPVKVVVTASQADTTFSSTVLVDVVNWAAEFADRQNSGRSKTLGPRTSENAVLLAVAPTSLGPNHTANIVALPGSRGVLLASYDATPNAGRHAYGYLSRNGWGSDIAFYDWFGYATADGSEVSNDFPIPAPSAFKAVNLGQTLEINQFEQPFVLSNQDLGLAAPSGLNTFMGVAPGTTFNSGFSITDLNFFGGPSPWSTNAVTGNMIPHADGSYEFTWWGMMPNGDFNDPPYEFDGAYSTKTGIIGDYYSPFSASGPNAVAANSKDVSYYVGDFGTLGINGNVVSLPDSSGKAPTVGTMDEAYVTGDSSVTSVSPAGTINWQSENLGTSLSTVKVGPDDTAYASFSDQSGVDYVIALNSSDGSIKWKTAVNGYVGCVDSVGTLYVVGSHGVLTILNSSGVAIASNRIDPTDIEEPALASDGKLYLLGSQRQKLYVIAPPALTDISSSNNTLNAGERATITIKLNEKAPGDGMTLQLSTDQPELLQVPQTVRVQGNATSVIFTVVANSTTLNAKATITATVQGSCASTENATLSLGLNVIGTGTGPTH